MAEYIDVKYVSLLANRIKNFKKRIGNVWNFSCPLCGDSRTHRTKARGYIFERENALFYRCHNCGVSITFGSFLKQFDESLYDEYLMERFGKKYEKSYSSNSATCRPQEFLDKFCRIGNNLRNVPTIGKLPDSHIAKQYCFHRKIPKEALEWLFYTEKFKKFVNEHVPGKFENVSNDEKRIIIPFFNVSGEVIGFQGRAIDKTNLVRYITIRTNLDYPMIYGMERVNLHKKIYVVEGPIDSLFLPNCVAAAGASLPKQFKDLGVFIFDNQPRNRQIVEIMKRYIEAGFSLCIWDKRNKYKDINDMICGEMTTRDVLWEIDKSVYSGLMALSQLAAWKEC